MNNNAEIATYAPADKWKADPVRGAFFLEERRAEIVGALENAADVGFAAIEEKLAHDIEQLRKAAGEKKSAILKTVEAARTRPVMEIVRKYWNETPSKMLDNMIHNFSPKVEP
jgi:hypothetical protein